MRKFIYLLLCGCLLSIWVNCYAWQMSVRWALRDSFPAGMYMRVFTSWNDFGGVAELNTIAGSKEGEKVIFDKSYETGLPEKAQAKIMLYDNFAFKKGITVCNIGYETIKDAFLHNRDLIILLTGLPAKMQCEPMMKTM